MLKKQFIMSDARPCVNEVIKRPCICSQAAPSLLNSSCPSLKLSSGGAFIARKRLITPRCRSEHAQCLPPAAAAADIHVGVVASFRGPISVRQLRAAFLSPLLAELAWLWVGERGGNVRLQRKRIKHKYGHCSSALLLPKYSR